MNIQESNNITVSDYEIKVEHFVDSSSVYKPSAQVISKESPTEEHFFLKEHSFVKHETVVFKTEEDDTFLELTESKFNERDIKLEFFDGLESIVHKDIVIKTEDQKEDQSNSDKFNEKEMKLEYLDGLESIVHEDIVIKTEDEEEDDSNSKFSGPDYEESHKTFTCIYCCTGLTTEKYKNAHERRCKFRKKEQHLGASVFECSHCKLRYIREKDKNKHQAVCKKKKQSEKREESATNRSKRKYCCDKCNYETQYKHCLVSHIRMHDKVNAPKYSCTQCPYQTIHNSYLKKHLRTHNGFGLICILCQKSFKEKSSLDAHYISRHPDRSDKWGSTITKKINECPKCLYKTVKKDYFKKHLATHEAPTDQAQFKCNVCGYKCIHKSNLVSHARLHVGQLPFVCIECDKTFNTKVHLNGHIISRHSENEELMSSVTSKVHQCEKCNFKTVNGSYFKRHLKTCIYPKELLSVYLA